jgi:TRAP-type mannitol/chloroaromatic compound transport system permease small subunit
MLSNLTISDTLNAIVLVVISYALAHNHKIRKVDIVYLWVAFLLETWTQD